MPIGTRLPRSFSKPSQPSSIHASSHPPPPSSSQRNTQRSDYRWPSALSPSPTYQSPVLVPSPHVSQTITRTAKRVARTLFSGTCLSNVPTPLTSPYAYLSASIATRLASQASTGKAYTILRHGHNWDISLNSRCRRTTPSQRKCLAPTLIVDIGFCGRRALQRWRCGSSGTRWILAARWCRGLLCDHLWKIWVADC